MARIKGTTRELEKVADKKDTIIGGLAAIGIPTAILAVFGAYCDYKDEKNLLREYARKGKHYKTLL